MLCHAVTYSHKSEIYFKNGEMKYVPLQEKVQKKRNVCGKRERRARFLQIWANKSKKRKQKENSERQLLEISYAKEGYACIEREGASAIERECESEGSLPNTAISSCNSHRPVADI